MRLVGSILVSLLILAAGFVVFRLLGSAPEPETREADSADSDGPLVSVVNARDWTSAFAVTVHGEAITPRVVTVAAEVAGNIVLKPDAIRSGRSVQQGDILFEIDPASYQLRVQELAAQKQQVEEEIRSLEISRRNTESLLKLAQEDWELQKRHLARLQDLFQKRTASETELDAAVERELAARNMLQTHQNELNTTQQKKRTTEAGLGLAEAALQRAELERQRCTVRSPMTGRIVDDVVEQGNYVQSGTTLVHISETESMEVKCSLRTEELAWIWRQGAFAEGQPDPRDPLRIPQVPCEVVWEFDGVETVWGAQISRLEGTGMDKQTRTFPCRVLVPEPRGGQVGSSPGGRSAIPAPALVSGMYVTIRIPVRSPEHLVQMPAEAIRPGGQVWVVRDNHLRILQADVARVEDTVALLRADASGVRAGDPIVVSPLAAVMDNMPVRQVGESAE